jgi:hypothetical protein
MKDANVGGSFSSRRSVSVKFGLGEVSTVQLVLSMVLGMALQEDLFFT